MREASAAVEAAAAVRTTAETTIADATLNVFLLFVSFGLFRGNRGGESDAEDRKTNGKDKLYMDRRIVIDQIV